MRAAVFNPTLPTRGSFLALQDLPTFTILRVLACRICGLLLIAISILAQGQTRAPETPTGKSAVVIASDARADLDSCHVHRVTGFPGSHQFASDFIETIATDPAASDS